MLLGTAALMTVVVFHGSQTVLRFETQLLDERAARARAVGKHIELLIAHDSKHLIQVALQVLASQAKAPAGAGPVLEVDSMVFSEVVAIQDVAGDSRMAPSTALDGADPPIELKELLARARQQERALISRLIKTAKGRPLMVFVTPVHDEAGKLLGCVAGSVEPTALQLAEIGSGGDERGGYLELLDRTGRVVLSEQGAAPGSQSDHEQVLTRALKDKRTVRRRCHNCHQKSGRPLREEQVLAFAPLPNLDLGVAVRQSEQAALEPARALRKRIWQWQGLLVGLFLLFGFLAVRRVARPVTRLARAVRRFEGDGSTGRLPSFSASELNQLATALEQWRGRVRESLGLAEQSEEALRDAVASANRLLSVLIDITESSIRSANVKAVVSHGLEQLLDVLSFDVGALCVSFGEQQFNAYRGLDDGEEDVFERCRRKLADQDAPPSTSGSMDQARLVEAASCPDIVGALDTGSVLLTDTTFAPGSRISCVLVSSKKHTEVDLQRLHSLLHHIAISAAHRHLDDEQSEHQRLRRELLRRVLAAQEDERLRVARELHDTVSQDLAALRLALERLSARPDDVRLAFRIQDLEGQVSDMLDTVRRIMLDLRPGVLDTMRFLPALRWYLERVESRHGVRGNLTVDGEPRALEPERVVTLFRIFQECLHNVVQHAGADHVMVTIAYAPNGISLMVEDDGHGFSVERLIRRSPDSGRGLGLIGIEERAKILDGTMSIESSPAEGTVVRVSVPFSPTQRGEES